MEEKKLSNEEMREVVGGYNLKDAKPAYFNPGQRVIKKGIYDKIYIVMYITRNSWDLGPDEDVYDVILSKGDDYTHYSFKGAELDAY